MQFAIVMFVVLVFILVLVAGLNGITRGDRRSPEEVLAARFAAGEIDEAEYSRRLSILRIGPPLELPD